jgi:hypothetical protein
MSKLTLSVDEKVIAHAKRYAERNGTSVSSMVETYLAEVSGVNKRKARIDMASTPIVDSLRGILKKGDIEDYRAYLVDKHG